MRIDDLLEDHMPDAIRYHKPGQDITCHANVAITGRRFVAIVGNRQSGPGLSATAEGGNYLVGNPAGGGRIFGVAAHDAPSGTKVNILRDGVVPVTASGAIAAFAEVEALADGRCITRTTGIPVGICLTAITDGLPAEIDLYKSGSLA